MIERVGRGGVPRVPHAVRWIATLLALLAAHAAVAAKTDPVAWSADAAVTVQREAERRVLAPRKGELAATRDARVQAWVQSLTGQGTTHPPRDRHLDDERRTTQLTTWARAQAKAHGVPVADVLAEVFPGAKSTALTMTLQTTADGVVTTGGYVFAYTSTGGTLYSPIAANGTISLAVAPGAQFDLVVHVNAPFAPQLVIGVQAQAGGVVTLRAGKRTVVRMTTAEPVAYAGSIGFVVRFETMAPYAGLFELSADTSFGPEPAVYLADNHSYTFSAELDVPWYATASVRATSANEELAFPVERGFALDVAFEDSDLLTTGCSVFPSLTVASDDLLGPVRTLSSGIEVRDGQDRVIGARATVPRGRPVDVMLTFATGGSACPLQVWRLDGARFVEDARERVVLRRRPELQLALQTPTGEALDWSGGTVLPVEAPEQRQIFFGTPGGVQLEAGREYVVLPGSPIITTVPRKRFVAQPGPFSVTAIAERLVDVKARLVAASGLALQGVMEFRRDNALVAAFEMVSGGDYDAKIPAGDYLVTASGLGGSANLASTGATVGVLLQERSFTRTISVAPGQRIDVDLALPDAGVEFNASGFDHPLHAVARVGTRPVAATWIDPSYVGLRSDLSPLDLRLRGPGFADAPLLLHPSAALPDVDLLALAGSPPRYTGTLRASNGMALANSPIELHSESGTLSRTFFTDAQGRFNLPFLRNATVSFLVPDAGADLGRFVRFGATPPAGGDVMLEALSFQAVDRAGPELQRFYGDGSGGYRIVFVSEGYTALDESFTDTNGNGVWDGVLFIDFNNDGIWQPTEPAKGYGDRSGPSPGMPGVDITANEPFVDENGDGYPSIDDFAVFEQNARNYVRALLATPEIRGGLAFDAYLLFQPSMQAGMDVEDAGNQTLVTRDTRFGARWYLERSLLSVNGGAVEAAIAAAIPAWNLQVVLLNQPVPAGRANAYILAIGGVGNTSPNDLVAGHEFGHNPGTLADEYDEFRGTSTAWFAPTQNLAHDPDDVDGAWSALLGARHDAPVSIPNSFGTGFYAGGNYQAGGVYRPSADSRMRRNAAEFNEPSRQRMAKALCRASLTEDGLALPPRNAGGGDAVFGSGFEPSNLPVVDCR